MGRDADITNLTPRGIATVPLCPVRVDALFTFAHTALDAWLADPAACAVDTHLSEQMSALYFPAHYTGRVGILPGATDAQMLDMARRLHAIGEILDVVDELSTDLLAA